MFLTVRMRTLALLLAVLIIIPFTFVAAFSPKEPEGIPLTVIMYHSIIDKSSYSGRYIIMPKHLEEDIAYLKENGYGFVTVADLINYVEKDLPLPEKPVMLTFDDGSYNNYLYALPLFEKYDARGVFSVIGVMCEKYAELDDKNPLYANLNWKHISELNDSGRVEIQNHSYNFHTAGTGREGSKKRKNETLDEYRNLLSSDLLKLQDLLEKHCGIIPTAFVYPYGAISKESFDIIKELGFNSSFSCTEGRNYITKNPDCLYMLKRNIRTPQISAEQIVERK